MANTYYDSQLTAAEIEAALEAINGILTPANNGKVLAISNGKFEARSVQWGGGSGVVQPLSVTQNGTYNPPSGVDGYAPVTVNISGGGDNAIEFTQNLLYDEYNTNTFQTELGGIYLWGSAYNGNRFTNADIICGNTGIIVTTSQWGRALCIFKAREASTVYNRGGGVYDLSKINTNVSILSGALVSWSSGNQDRAIETGHLYMFMGPQVSTDTPGTFTGATVVSQLMQGDASHGYHHGAVILAIANTLGYSVSGTNYLAEIGLYGENEYHVIT